MLGRAGTVADWLKLSLFTEYPEEYFALVVVKEGGPDGKTVYDGQVRPLFTQKEFRHILDMPFKGYYPTPGTILNIVFV